MKKILFFVLLTAVFFLLVKSVNAVSPTIVPVNNEVEYALAYPGLLPDHPLYPLKVIRDKIYDFFLSDLVKKSEFKLLMADKRLFMAIMLKDRQKIEMAEQTISKGSKYFEEAVLSMYKAKEAGRDIVNLRQKLILSSRKQVQIITSIQQYASENIKAGLQGSLDRINKYQSQLLTDVGK